MKDLPPGVWGDQFDPSLDYPPTPIAKKYVICTSPRSGSHFLGHLLHEAGGFGYPLEYLQTANFQVWTRRAREAGHHDTYAYVKSVRTGPNGVFGVKAHYRHLPRLLENEPDILNYRFILLERRNVLQQAVSYAWAAQTKSWISGMPEVTAPQYDWELIAEKLRTIAEGNAGWRSFVRQLGIETCDLVFEDVREDVPATIERIAAFIGVDPTGAGDRARFFPREQRDPEKAEWARRFVAESRERLGTGQLFAQSTQEKRQPSLRSRLKRLLTSGRHGS